MAAYRSVTVLRRVGPRQISGFRAQSTLVSDLAPMPAVAKELFLGRLDPRVLSYPDVISSNPERMHELNVRCRYSTNLMSAKNKKSPWKLHPPEQSGTSSTRLGTRWTLVSLTGRC